MPRETDLDLNVRKCFDELLGEIDELRESLSDLEDRVEKLEGDKGAVVSPVPSFRLDSGEIRWSR